MVWCGMVGVVCLECCEMMQRVVKPLIYDLQNLSAHISVYEMPVAFSKYL